MITHMMLPNATPVAGEPEPSGFSAWFVDSVNGDDEANGTTAATPFASLARLTLETLTSSSYVHLATGSRFREELTGLTAGVRVRSYGYGARPIIDGRDIAPNGLFTKTSGRTNVYEIAWAHGFGEDGGKSAHRVWEDDVMMTRAASLAACDSTPGSFYAGTPTTAGPDTVYVHPTGSVSPGREYTLAKRRWCVQLYESYNQGRVTGLETIGNSHADGSLCIDGYVEGCVARDGRVHNAFILGEAVECQALATEPGINSTMFVSYVDASASFGGPQNRNVLYRDCLADTQTDGEGVTGFYVHTNGTRIFGAIEYRSCRAVGMDVAFGGIQASKFVTYCCTYDDVEIAYNLIAVENYILGGEGKVRTGEFFGGLFIVSTSIPDLSWVVHGCKVYAPSNYSQFDLSAAGSTVTVERCTFTGPGSAVVVLRRGDVTFKHNVLSGGFPLWVGTAGAQLDGLDTDYNCYWVPAWNNGVFGSEYPSHVDYLTIATWRTYLNEVDLGAGQDANSIAQNALVADPANLDFTIGNATALSMGAGAEVDEEDDPELQAYWLANRVTEV